MKDALEFIEMLTVVVGLFIVMFGLYVIVPFSVAWLVAQWVGL